MDRRSFVAKSSLSALAGFTLGHVAFGQPTDVARLIKPKALKKGDTIGLITPASAVPRSTFEKALHNLESLGLNVVYSDNMSVRKGFLAGTDQQRLGDLHVMFENPSVDGIICARGGYGSGRLLGRINYDLIQANPKVFMGFSDITALLYAIHKMTGMICFHGPVGGSEFSDFTRGSIEDVLFKGKKSVSVNRPRSWKDNEDVEFEGFVINQGEASGQLIGGNLSLMTSILGTPYDVDYSNKILFIEEIGESPYRLDRMLTQLLNSGKLNSVNGIVLGVFRGCETKPNDPDFNLSVSLKEVLRDRFGGLNVPVMYGLPIGHIDDNATIPIGIEARMNTERMSLGFLESAVV